MTVYGIGGVSGTGKSHFRTTCDALRSSRTIDIADVYEDAVARGQPNLHWRVALKLFASTFRQLLEADRCRDLVLEAFFRPGGVQRKAVESVAREFGVDVR